MEISRNLEKHNFTKNAHFQQVLSNNLLIQGHETGIRELKMRIYGISK